MRIKVDKKSILETQILENEDVLDTIADDDDEIGLASYMAPAIIGAAGAGYALNKPKVDAYVSNKVGDAKTAVNNTVADKVEMTKAAAKAAKATGKEAANDFKMGASQGYNRGIHFGNQGTVKNAGITFGKSGRAMRNNVTGKINSVNDNIQAKLKRYKFN